MRIVFIMDPISTIVPDQDTTYALMSAALDRGYSVSHCLVRDVQWRSGEVFASVRPVIVENGAPAPVRLGDAAERSLADVDVVFVRKDPPFDADYLWLTLMLEALRGRAVVVNDPRGLREANEKLYVCHFPELMPETLVSADGGGIRQFVRQVGGAAVIKPIDGFAGKGVFLLSDSDLNFNTIVETVTHEGQRAAVVQRFLPEVRIGDKRILVVDGEPLGAILRVPRQDEARSNIHVGGTVLAADLDDDDRYIIERLAPRLRADGLWFVGLDVIGGKLTEVNVTSPTGIQQMSRLTGVDLPGRVLDALEAKRLAC